MDIRERIKAMFLLCYAGDAIGCVVEGWTAEKIKETYGRVTTFLVPNGHKWFDGRPAGLPTDDWALTKCIAEAMITNGLDMDAQAAAFVAASKASMDGWGNTTREAARRLSNGSKWDNSGVVGGYGNGVMMKVAPIGAYLAAKLAANQDVIEDVLQFTANLGCMTHKTRAAVGAGLAQMLAIYYCMSHEPGDFKPQVFIKEVVAISDYAKFVVPDEDKKNFSNVLEGIGNYAVLSPEEISKQFGGGACYCYHSAPFTLAYFLRNPTSIEAFFDVINAGGDTDTNASMVGALLGALNGMAVVPPDMVQQMPEQYAKEVLDLADRFATFCEKPLELAAT